MTIDVTGAFALMLAERVIEEHGTDARLVEIETVANEMPELQNVDLGDLELLFEEVRDEIAARGSGRRR